jgi:hypothetical protein
MDEEGRKQTWGERKGGLFCFSMRAHGSKFEARNGRRAFSSNDWNTEPFAWSLAFRQPSSSAYQIAIVCPDSGIPRQLQAEIDCSLNHGILRFPYLARDPTSKLDWVR